MLREHDIDLAAYNILGCDCKDGLDSTNDRKYESLVCRI